MVLFIKKCSGASMYNLYDEEEEDNPPPISQVCFIKTHCFMNFNVQQLLSLRHLKFPSIFALLVTIHVHLINDWI